MKLKSLWLRALLFRLILFSIIWWGLSEGRIPYLLPPALFVIMAAGVSMFSVPPGKWTIRLLAVPEFIVFFLIQTFLAGLEVAFRAFHPRLPLETGLISYTPGLSRQSAKIFLVWIISLLPGTASISFEENRVLIHVLDTEQVHQEKLLAIEKRVASLFG
ncbi:Na+/H+ antiporter subunit E [Desulfopila inferna]|uniref:Na+/H+ antiporter subunit E n=1 Tax=Desulfopila inferna TaxID=468528 RepID=UPI001962CF05|nr:Na+/H+ antiporter subunit E [Desulfopila inferna]MBM9604865.1 Na+/H+ antiporter subunit E [Desulfopila inferna]